VIKDIHEAVENNKNQNQTFFRGVIEDNNDPLFLGRVKVRILGVHSEDQEETAVEDLPWAECLVSADLGLVSGIGISSVPEQGCYCWVFFDGQNQNKPVVIGITAGYRKQRDVISFCDKDLKYPLLSRLDEPDFNRIARADKQEDTTLGKKQSDPKISEPIENYKKSKYTKNKVLETSSGHFIEIDDTEGNERIHIFHNTGTLIEMLPDGKIVIKSMNDSYEIVNGTRRTHVTANSIEFIDNNSDKTVEGNETVTINGNMTLKVGGNLDITTGGTTTFKSGGSFKVTAPRIDLN